MVPTDGGILRLAVGSGSAQIHNQRAALSALRAAASVPALVSDRAPRELAGGRVGIAEWSLESKLGGVRPPRSVTGALLRDCLEFLGALHGIGPREPVEGVFLDQAELLAAVCAPGSAEVLRRLAGRLERDLRGIPRGFAHGDFFHGNLLAQGGRLVAVVDWEAAGPRRLPFVDLLHLVLTSASEMGDADWGPMLLRHLLPWVGRGGGHLIREYCSRTGVEIDAPDLRALVAAYWLEYAHHQLCTHPHRFDQPRWLERNLDFVLPVIAQPGFFSS
jgi:Ser/Thr protein kinase RdoA (MazF antagonist)